MFSVNKFAFITAFACNKLYIYIYIYIHAYTYDAPPKHTMGSTIESLQPISKNDESVVEYFFAENLFL